MSWMGHGLGLENRLSQPGQLAKTVGQIELNWSEVTFRAWYFKYSKAALTLRAYMLVYVHMRA